MVMAGPHLLRVLREFVMSGSVERPPGFDDFDKAGYLMKNRPPPFLAETMPGDLVDAGSCRSIPRA